MSASFDTTRLDEECERIALQCGRSFVKPGDVKAVLLGAPRPPHWCHTTWQFLAMRVYDLCRRPKMVNA